MTITGKIVEWTLQDIIAEKRLIAHRGGTRSGKTYSILLTLVLVSLKRNCSIDVVSESLPHLKRGAIHDFEEIIDNGEFQVEVNKTDKTYTFTSGAVIRFFSADDWGKVKGSRRDVLYINEANRIPYETYRQLAVRTKQTIIIDWNPDSEYWYEQKGLAIEYPPHVSTYKDNPHLDAAQIAEIESNKNDVNWWNVYGLGQVGKVESLIFKNWEQISELPQNAKLVGYGLDFGFTQDPTAIVGVYKQDGYIILDEVLYEKGLTNDKIANVLLAQPIADVVADSAEQKSIREIYNYGIRRIEGAVKGRDSILNGIDIMQRYTYKVTAQSLNLITELRNYKWREDKITGELLNIPIDKYNHAIDAVRYLISAKLNNQPRTQGIKRIAIK